jgi:hypothetical protein
MPSTDDGNTWRCFVCGIDMPDAESPEPAPALPAGCPTEVVLYVAEGVVSLTPAPYAGLHRTAVLFVPATVVERLWEKRDTAIRLMHSEHDRADAAEAEAKRLRLHSEEAYDRGISENAYELQKLKLRLDCFDQEIRDVAKALGAGEETTYEAAFRIMKELAAKTAELEAMRAAGAPHEGESLHPVARRIVAPTFSTVEEPAEQFRALRDACEVSLRRIRFDATTLPVIALTFTAHAHGIQLSARIDVPARDSEPMQWWEIWRTLLVPWVVLKTNGPDYIVGWTRETIANLLAHEVAENMTVDGHRVFDPHRSIESLYIAALPASGTGDTKETT